MIFSKPANVLFVIMLGQLSFFVGFNHSGHDLRCFGILGKCSSWHESSHFLNTGGQTHGVHLVGFFQGNAYFYLSELLID